MFVSDRIFKENIDRLTIARHGTIFWSSNTHFGVAPISFLPNIYILSKHFYSLTFLLTFSLKKFISNIFCDDIFLTYS